MKKFILITIVLFLPLSIQAQQKTTSNESAEAGLDSGAVKAKSYIPVHEYDSKRNAENDLKDAIAEAKRTNKRVILEVGGLWCSWCKILDNYFAKHKELLEYREKNFIMLKINFSPENENKTFLSQYPKIDGYPHIFILESEGTLLHSQNTGDLEEGKSYNFDKMFEFLKTWAPSKQ